MRAVLRLAGRRLAHRWPILVAAGLLVGVGYGICLASVNAGRRTESAYERVLAAADAPDAAVAHTLSPDEAEQRLGSIDGVLDLRHSVGFVGTVDGVDPALARAMIGATGDRFPLELPKLRSGRLPRPRSADEVFVNEFLADRGGLELGEPLDLQLFSPDFSTVADAHATVVGIGSMPREAVIDETTAFGLLVFSRAFSEQHRGFEIYATTTLDLAPGVDARRDLAVDIGRAGGELSEVRSQGQQAVDDALGPLVTLLFALGLLAFVASTVAVGQVIQRDQERWHADDEHLRVLGMVRAQVVLARLSSALLIAVVAIVTALGVTAATSPLAPFGPLHELDPGQGVVVDLTVAVVGALAILAAIGMAALAFAWSRRTGARPDVRAARSRASAARRPAASAGLGLAFNSRRTRTWRAVGFAVAAVTISATVGTLVASAVALSEAPERYGFDWDVLALNPYGDQTPEGLQALVGDDPDVVAATGFSGWTFLVDGRAVPGFGATRLKGDLGPTILRGHGVRAADEIVLGQDTLDALGVDIGERVDVQVAAFSETQVAPIPLRVVGVATFPPVSQVGTDQPRLGTGALVTRATFDRMAATDEDEPEWTAVRLAAGADPAVFIARHPDGVPDAVGAPTSWFTDAKPAELRQLDSVRAVLVGAVAISYVILLAVMAHALWATTRANRRDLAVLRVLGFTRRQLGEVAAWLAVPFAVAAVVVGIPLGIALGARAFSWFAASLAVVDRAAVSAPLVVGLVLATIVAVAIGAVGAIGTARRTRPSAVLREE
jgi:hypothetical protein